MGRKDKPVLDRKATRVGVFFERDYIQNSYLHLLSSYYMPNTLPYIGDVMVEVTRNPYFHETNQLIKYLTINDSQITRIQYVLMKIHQLLTQYLLLFLQSTQFVDGVT